MRSLIGSVFGKALGPGQVRIEIEQRLKCIEN